MKKKVFGSWPLIEPSLLDLNPSKILEVFFQNAYWVLKFLEVYAWISMYDTYQTENIKEPFHNVI